MLDVYRKRSAAREPGHWQEWRPPAGDLAMAGILSPTLIMVRPEGGVGFLAKLGLNTPGGALQLRDSDAGRFLGAALRGRRAHGTYGAHGWPARRAQPHLDGFDDARPLHPARVASGKLWCAPPETRFYLVSIRAALRIGKCRTEFGGNRCVESFGYGTTPRIGFRRILSGSS